MSRPFFLLHYVCGFGLTGCRYFWLGCESGERGYGYLLEEGVCCADAERDGRSLGVLG